MTIMTFEKRLIKQIEDLEANPQDIIAMSGDTYDALIILTMAIDYLELEFKFSLMEIVTDGDSYLEARADSKLLDRVVIIDHQVLLNSDYKRNLNTLYQLYRTAEGIK